VQTANPYNKPPANAPRNGFEIVGINDMKSSHGIFNESKYRKRSFKSYTI
jgi:hypothetical protein